MTRRDAISLVLFVVVGAAAAGVAYVRFAKPAAPTRITIKSLASQPFDIALTPPGGTLSRQSLPAMGTTAFAFAPDSRIDIYEDKVDSPAGSWVIHEIQGPLEISRIGIEIQISGDGLRVSEVPH